MKQQIIEVVLKRYEYINIDSEIVNNLYNEIIIKLNNSNIEITDVTIYFELSKLIDKYLIDKIKSGDDETKLALLLSNYNLINRLLNKNGLNNKKESIDLGEVAVEQSIEEYDSDELFSVQVVRKLNKVLKKSL